jgi:hypothetical protein
VAKDKDNDVKMKELIINQQAKKKIRVQNFVKRNTPVQEVDKSGSTRTTLASAG